MFSLKDRTHPLFLQKTYIAHFLSPTSLWMKVGLWGLTDYCCDALKPSKGLQTWDLLLRDHGLYSPKWQATTQLHQWARTGRCSHLSGLLLRPGLVSKHVAAIKATRFPAAASLQPAQTLTLFLKSTSWFSPITLYMFSDIPEWNMYLLSDWLVSGFYYFIFFF